MEKVRVLIVDDSRDLTALYRKAIGGEPDLEPIGVLHNADGLVKSVETLRPDVVLLDLTMPGKNPLEAIEEMTAATPGVHVIVFSGYDAEQTVHQALTLGARGYVSKSQDIPVVLETIRRVAAGQCVTPNSDSAN